MPIGPIRPRQAPDIPREVIRRRALCETLRVGSALALVVSTIWCAFTFLGWPYGAGAIAAWIFLLCVYAGAKEDATWGRL